MTSTKYVLFSIHSAYTLTPIHCKSQEHDKEFVHKEDEKEKLALYPLSLIIVGVWIVYIIATIIVLEKAAAAAPRSVHQPWGFSALPNLMLTLFAQAHGTITAMHLARIGVSALQSPRTSPRSWAELFWLADRSWQGPVGVITTGVAMRKMKVRVSNLFVMFALTCMVALVTPVILSRAYRVGVVNVRLTTSITPSTISSKGLESVDAYAQIGIGSGSWATGLSVLDVYNSSTFVPPGQAQTNTSDIFFAGDIQDAEAELPGLRLRGSCQPYINDAATSVETNTTSLSTFCANTLSSTGDINGNISVVHWGNRITYSYCTDVQHFVSAFDTNITESIANAYIYFDATNGTVSTKGMVKCQSSLSLGTALLSGSQGTFQSFQESSLYSVSKASGGEDLQDPLAALLNFLGANATASDLQAMMATQLGYKAFNDPYDPAELDFTQPTLSDLADNIWVGVAHMTAGIGLLSRTSDTVYSATVQQTTFGRIRSTKFAVGAIALLSVWLVALTYATARSYRMTFSDSLNSYVAGRLLTKEVRLVEGYPSGQLSDNPRLSEHFVIDY